MANGPTRKRGRTPSRPVHPVSYPFPFGCHAGREERAADIDTVGKSEFAVNGDGRIPQQDFVPGGAGIPATFSGSCKDRCDILPFRDDGLCYQDFIVLEFPCG